MKSYVTVSARLPEAKGASLFGGLWNQRQKCRKVNSNRPIS